MPRASRVYVPENKPPMGPARAREGVGGHSTGKRYPAAQVMIAFLLHHALKSRGVLIEQILSD